MYVPNIAWDIPILETNYFFFYLKFKITRHLVFYLGTLSPRVVHHLKLFSSIPGAENRENSHV